MQTYEQYKKIIEENLESYLEDKYPQKLWEAMRYSVMAGGKRLRPVLLLEVCNSLCGDYTRAIPSACAIEMVHVYSLIHDDLPCMDNDDYRRGKLTNHKVYGEAMALLAGDALLTLAPQIVIQKTPSFVKKDILLKIVEEFSLSSGAMGMIGGQVMDILSESKTVSKETLKYIHQNKTAEMFKLAFRVGAILAEAKEEDIEIITKIANDFGNAFQIADDILDVTETLETLGKTPNKDVLADKATYVSIYGLDEAIKQVNYLCDGILQSIKKSLIDSPIIIGIVQNMQNKINNVKGGLCGNN